MTNASSLRRLATLVCLTLAAALPTRAELRLQDASGSEVVLPAPARRIVSLAPHITELLFAAGAGDRVVGAVEYSNYPAAARWLPRIGSYNALDLEAIAALRPDLAIAWRSGNREGHLDRLRALGIPLFVSEARDLGAVADSLEMIGQLAGTGPTATQAASAFRARRDRLRASYAGQPPVPTFYQVWNTPLMTINDAHLIGDVLRLCGGHNVFGELAQLAPTINEEAVLAADPEAIIASGMDEARPEWLDDWRRWSGMQAVRRGNLFFVPPDLLQRHTPRILDGAEQVCRHLATARERRPAPGRD
ncbi:MAG: cobalamin-binding protein [Rhodocyclaceae bacterium]|nr:cobalamin-binding protein [Rhodocyclaceae bacterium]